MASANLWGFTVVDGAPVHVFCRKIHKCIQYPPTKMNDHFSGKETLRSKKFETAIIFTIIFENSTKSLKQSKTSKISKF